MLSELALGFGCKTGVRAQDVAGLARALLAEAPPFKHARMFTPARKGREAGLHEAAAALGLELILLDDAEFLARQPEFLARGAAPSARALAATGLSSVAEAAALMGGGPGARLILRRRAAAGVTCALAAQAQELER
jgi:cobalt-precorrin 5A hydrolase